MIAYCSPLALAGSSTRVGRVEVKDTGVAHEGLCELFSMDRLKTKRKAAKLGGAKAQDGS